METKVNQNTFNTEVLTKRLYELNRDEIKNNFKQVKCLIRRQKIGKGDSATYRYSAVLMFHEAYQIQFKLKQEEYLNICLGRNVNLNAIPETLKISAYYVPVKAKKQNSDEYFFQLKVVFNTNVRKKTFLRDLEVLNADSMKIFEFYERPDFVEDDLDERNFED